MALAIRLLLRDLRSGELSLLLASLVIAVGTVTTITLFVDRLQQALLLESSSFIAADKVIASSRPVPDSITESAERLGLQSSQTLSFLSMAFSAERAQLAAVKAVDDRYPLRGKLIVADAPFGKGRVEGSGPRSGEIWMESRLFPSLDIALGESVDIGALTLPTRRVLLKEPDRGGGFDTVAPRIVMNLADVPGT